MDVRNCRKITCKDARAFFRKTRRKKRRALTVRKAFCNAVLRKTSREDLQAVDRQFLSINEDENLYRYVNKTPDLWNGEFNRPTSALFKDKNGVSVDRGGGRNDAQVSDVFIKRIGADNLRCVVYVSARYCSEIDAYVVSLPLPDNEYHAEIHNSSTEKPLTKGKARLLSKNCSVLTLTICA